MQTQNTAQENNNNAVDTNKYVPSSSDKKRAIMMYLVLGIMVWLSKKNMNNFEYYHLKQAAGRWMIFILILVFAIVLLFIPIIKYLAIIPLIVLVVVWAINIKQARDWKYFINKKDSPLALFSWVGAWFIDLFEIGVKTPKFNIDDLSDLPDEISVWKNINTQENSNNPEESDIEMDLNNQ